MSDLSRRQFFRFGRKDEMEESRSRWRHVYRSAMGCRFDIAVAASEPSSIAAAQQALETVARLDEQLSVYRESSEISDINNRAFTEQVVVDEQLLGLFLMARHLHRETEGAFDITAGPILRCWGLIERQSRVPHSDELEDARSRSGMPLLILDAAARAVQFARPGMELNLVHIGKGYALDRAATFLRSRGVRAALLNAGSGNAVALGSASERRGWQVRIRDPRNRNACLANIFLRDAALGTRSGSGYSSSTEDSTHSPVLDPRTGWPAEGVSTVAVVSRSGAMADALAAAFFIGGRELAERYCASHPEVAVLMLEQQEGGEAILLGHSDHCEIQVSPADPSLAVHRE